MKTDFRLFLLFLLVILLMTTVSGSVRPPGQNSSGSEPLIYLERGVCFGACPVYNVSIYQNGSVRYEGIRYVHDTGAEFDNISPDNVSTLFSYLEDNGFFDLNDTYTGYHITDMPSVTVSVMKGNRTKVVEHYHGDTTAPEILSRMEDAID